LRIAVVDDLARDRAGLLEYLQRFYSSEAMIFEYDSGEAFLSAYRPGDFGRVFLDCCMGGVSGMDAANAIRAAGDGCSIVFTTTSRDYAVDGYRVRATGYLVKPYTYEELSALLLMDVPRERPFVELPMGGAGVKLLLSHILWCEAHGHYVLVHTAGNGEMTVRISFTELSALLLPYPQFLVCCRGCLVNLDQVKSFSGSDFILHDGTNVPIRQRESEAAVRAYAEYQFRKVRGEL